MNPSQAVIAYLHQVRRRVGEIWTAPTQDPPDRDAIPDFDALVAAAEKIDPAAPDTSAYVAFVIKSLLGRASAVDGETPLPRTPVFPADHALHLDMGSEWYWLGVVVQVVNVHDPADIGRIAVLYSIQRTRAVGITVQKLAGWDDRAAQLADSVCTVTVDTTLDKSYHRRLPNAQWPAVGGRAAWSAPGEPLRFECGSDVIAGSIDVLPLKMIVDDKPAGGTMRVALTFDQPGMTPDDAFFLQGGLAAPPGVTPPPKPGIYYSWPQLHVTGTIEVGGRTYEVTGGNAWMDHQLMASSLLNTDNAVEPIPFVGDPTPIDGWSWQYFNLNNGDAFTLASFQSGTLDTHPPVVYGFYLKRDPTEGTWISSRMMGAMQLKDFRDFPIDAGGGPPAHGPGTASIPTLWTYLLGSLGPTPLALGAEARHWWTDDGTFNNPNGELAAELPVDVHDLALGVGSHSGTGFCESIGFEPVPQFRARALAYLASVPGRQER